MTHPAHLLLFEPRPNSPWAHDEKEGSEVTGEGHRERPIRGGSDKMDEAMEELARRQQKHGHPIGRTERVRPCFTFHQRRRKAAAKIRDYGWRKLEVGSHGDMVQYRDMGALPLAMTTERGSNAFSRACSRIRIHP